MKEPKIMQMDWKALGYERQYKDGRLRWIPKLQPQDRENEDTPT
jgi:hypothetical protein